MRRSGTSAYATALPQPQRTAVVVSIEGRDRIARRGVYIGLRGGRLRMLYQQFDGSVELADLCTCATDWRPDFEVRRSHGCAIDQHRREAVEKEDW